MIKQEMIISATFHLRQLFDYFLLAHKNNPLFNIEVWEEEFYKTTMGDIFFDMTSFGYEDRVELFDSRGWMDNFELPDYQDFVTIVRRFRDMSLDIEEDPAYDLFGCYFFDWAFGWMCEWIEQVMYAYDAKKYLKYRDETEGGDLILEDLIIGD